MDLELVPYSGRLWGVPRSFKVGTVERKLEWPEGTPRLQRARAPLVGSVVVDGHVVAVTLQTIRPSYRTAVRRNLRGAKVTGPLSFLGFLLGGSGLGGGMAAAAQSNLAWLIYELALDAEPQGSWVAKTVDDHVQSWTFVPAGDPLPDGETSD